MATKTKQTQAKPAEPAAIIAMADAVVSHDAQSVDANMEQLQAVAIAIAKKEGSITTAAILERLRTHILETMPKRV